LQSTDDPEKARNKTLILIHGRGFKPARSDLEALWIQALRTGLGRDATQALPAFDRCRCEFVYYGDEINAVLAATGRRYDAALDLADLKNTLAALAALSKPRQFRREHYERLPGKTALKEFLADIGAPALSAIGLKERALVRFIPELADYWHASESRLRPVTARLCDVVGDAMQRGDDIVLVSHCIGSVIAYDALWALCRGGHRGGACADGKVTAWLTLGAPLGDESVKARLHGASAEPSARHPNNVLAWLNFAAEDDYICHDDRLADDYAGMLDGRLVSRLDDARIYNLAVRYGRSNPHNALGYLAHPRVGRAVAQWLVGPLESDAAR
jgi:hypothetical protein